MKKIIDCLSSTKTGLDAIKLAPIVDNYTGIKCLRINDINSKNKFECWGNTEVKIQKYNNFLIKRNQIFLARTGSPGSLFFAKKNLNSVFNNGLIRLEVKKEFEPFYIYLLLNSKNIQKAIKSVSISSTTRPNLRINDLLNINCRLHNYKTQQHIVNTIGTIDDLIEKYEEIINKFEDLGNKNIELIFYKNNLEDIKKYCKFEKGIEVGSQNYLEFKNENTIKYIRVSDLSGEYKNTYIDKKIKYKICDYNDILITFDGAPGRMAVGLKGAISSSINIVKPFNKNYAGLIYFSLKNKHNKEIIRLHSKGTTILHAKESIDYLKIPKTEIREIQNINFYFELIIKIKIKLKTLIEIKDILLNKYF
ncbi:hypothetical protein FJO69_02000 [[Mycoplasma] falconis]|uniref:Type I restriction modification DNA specificity domain-containing protein n=1 Tax=[Mycoplasma] falconis TaxID=92403 RepID=A0A501X9V9_9BACT|nr:restriction endonuclease subunit S [[Mycoplasma] falconis]TPE57378.1 hypothetical protein FJO69_02000 [[Mycoplasma] falconis]